MTASNEKKKKRYAEDPEYREERLACSRASYHAHKEERRAYMRAYYLAHRDEIIARRRQERAAGIVKPKDPRVARASRLQRVYGISLAGYEACSRGRAARARSASDPGYRCAWIIAMSPDGCAVCSVAVAIRRSVSCGTIRAW
jgi:hypothetical protein